MCSLNHSVFYHINCCKLFFAFALFIGFGSLQAQQGETRRSGSRIIDDTTRQIYGPTTSRYYYEDDVFYNNDFFFPIDTVIRNFHRYTYVQRYDYMYQDLGNVGTASRPVFYRVPVGIGVSHGVESFDLYWEAPGIRYFDTKSPYTNMKVALGGKGRSLTNVTFSRNINPRWNFGFDYRGLFIDKQIQRRGKGDRNVRSTYYDIFTTYQSKDSTYRVFFNFARNNFEVDEYGGIQPDDSFEPSDLFGINVRPAFTEAESNELRMNIHLYHQYKVGSALQLYHTMDRYRQANRFLTSSPAELSPYYHSRVIDSDTIYDATKLISFRNEAGVKGKLLKLFYNGYYSIRRYSMDYNNLVGEGIQLNGAPVQVQTSGTEHYLGGRMALQLDSLMLLRGWVEVMSGGDYNNYRVEGELKSKWLEASLKQNQYAPSFMQQAYLGAFHEWNNFFSSTQATQLNGYIHYRSKNVHISPGVTFNNLYNYIFFRDTSTVQNIRAVMPVQSGGFQTSVSPELRLSVTFFKRFTWRSAAIYTKMLKNDDDAVRVPDIFVNSQLAYENIFFRGNLELHTGVDFHWKSEYRALGYDPVIQQFFVQDRILSPEFPIVDIFVNAKIKRGRIFVKYHNLFKALSTYGYIPTPMYPGQINVIDFGFDWSFYD